MLDLKTRKRYDKHGADITDAPSMWRDDLDLVPYSDFLDVLKRSNELEKECKQITELCKSLFPAMRVVVNKVESIKIAVNTYDMRQT